MSEKSYNRYYSKGKYEAAIGIFGTGLVFLFVAIGSLVLRYLEIEFIGLADWGYFLFIPAFFIILGGFGQLYTNYNYKKSIMVTIADRNYEGTHKLENLALEIGIKPSDVLRVLLDLRAKGKVRYKFNPETGEIVLGEKIQYDKAEEYIPPPKKIDKPIVSSGKSFCPYCGHHLIKEAKFCENCGSKI
ncbi:MAG: zinc ribbon domain-containing protein [Candidatus Lokiarchaeota archaeon]|nr:zinc ribbon domain-containing protein [Candidatus Lokiarchaeota archaeon]